MSYFMQAWPCMQVLESAVEILAIDNLELACTVIEKTATDKAVRDIDERLAPAYQVCHIFAEAREVKCSKDS
jgi:CCR4-NOT transcription complex subunit 1